MQGRAPPFGKRNRAPVAAGVVRPAPPPPAADANAHRAVFEAWRAEEAGPEPSAASEVPRSLRAAVLAGIVVACGLAGLDATERIAALRGITEAIPGRPEVPLLVPALVLLAVIGGGRSAATSLLVAHSVLSRAGRTGHLAYTLGGAAAAAALAAALLLALGQAPAHGFAVDVLAGAAGGFFYRVFAGARAASGAVRV